MPLIGETMGVHFDKAVERWGDRERSSCASRACGGATPSSSERVDAFAAGLLALGPGAGRPHRHLVAQQRRMGGDAVRHRQGRADPGQHQSRLPPGRAGIRAEQGGLPALVTAPSFKTSDYVGMLRTLAPEARRQRARPSATRRSCRRCASSSRSARDERPASSASTSVCGHGRRRRARRSWPSCAGKLQFDEPINIQFTSGTTGAPKGATLTHHNILNNGFFIGEAMQLTEQDRVCIPVPLYHCFGMVIGNLACITHGAAMVYPGEGFDPLATLETVAAERCTSLYGVPTMFIAELDHPDFAQLRSDAACAPA